MNDAIAFNERRITRELQLRGVAPAERTEREVVIQKGRAVGCVIRCFFKQEFQSVLAFGESIIEALTGFGSVIHRLSDGQEDEAVLEVSFRF